MADRDVTNPGDSDIISAYPANERAQRQAQSDIFNQDHFDPNDADQGKHRQVSLKVLGGDPTSATNYGHVYTKIVNGNAELFFQDDDGAGNVIQLTNGGLLNNDIVNMPQQASDPSTPVASGNLYTKVFNGNPELFWQDALGNIVRITFQGELVINLSTTDVIVGSLRTNNFFRGNRETLTIVAGAVDFDFESATVFELTVTENVVGTLSNMPDTADGEEQTLYIQVNNGGAFTTALASAYTIIRPGGVVKPFTVSGKDMVIVSTHDGVNLLADTILDFK